MGDERIERFTGCTVNINKEA